MYRLLFLSALLFFSTCQVATDLAEPRPDEMVITFGSCNKQYEKNTLWPEVLKHHPTAWLWGGDVIYSDTEDMAEKAEDYQEQLNQKAYKALLENTTVIGTWDDHDYGLNDGGKEYRKKAESQDLFLDFLGISKEDSRRDQQGVYHSETFTNKKGSVKVLLLDTRYFRTALKKSNQKGRRYDPNPDENATILGQAQWTWLENELTNSTADFNLILSSIQILSAEHGFESWGNFPKERQKLFDLIGESNAQGVILLSGDRHISEFSKKEIPELGYPLIEFTSSGLTHSYDSFSGEPNNLRFGKVVSDVSFGLLRFDFNQKAVTFEMRGKKNKLQQRIRQEY